MSYQMTAKKKKVRQKQRFLDVFNEIQTEDRQIKKEKFPSGLLQDERRDIRQPQSWTKENKLCSKITKTEANNAKKKKKESQTEQGRTLSLSLTCYNKPCVLVQLNVVWRSLRKHCRQDCKNLAAHVGLYRDGPW